MPPKKTSRSRSEQAPAPASDRSPSATRRRNHRPLKGPEPAERAGRVARQEARRKRREAEFPKRWRCRPACKPGSVRRFAYAWRHDDHSSATAFARRLVGALSAISDKTRATRSKHPGPHLRESTAPILSCSGWGFPCRHESPRAAVRSYRTVSPSPGTTTRVSKSRLAGQSVLCCTFRRLAPPCISQAPCFVEPGLSSSVPYGKPAIAPLGLTSAAVGSAHDKNRQAVAKISA